LWLKVHANSSKGEAKTLSPPSGFKSIGTQSLSLASILEMITIVPDQEWIKTLEDGRKVKFIYQELPEDAAFLSAQLAGNEVVYSVVLTKAGNPLSREDVESHFEGELSKQQ
jgi:hypothetical protein